MTPQEALEFLANVTAEIPANRRTHQKIGQALTVLGAAVTPQQPQGMAGVASKEVSKVSAVGEKIDPKK